MSLSNPRHLLVHQSRLKLTLAETELVCLCYFNKVKFQYS